LIKAGFTSVTFKKSADDCSAFLFGDDANSSNEFSLYSMPAMTLLIAKFSISESYWDKPF
jgi:hypothetical protein